MKYQVKRISFQSVTVEEYAEVEAPEGLDDEALYDWMYDEQYDFDWTVTYEDCTDHYVEDLNWEEVK